MRQTYQAKMRKIILYTSLLAIVSCGKTAEMEEESVEGSSVYAFSFDGTSYEIVKENKTWTDAVSFAVARGGYLSEINSEEEQNAVFLELTTKAGIVLDETNNEFGYAAVWLGGNDLAEEGSWVWNGDNEESGVAFWIGGVDGSAVNGLYNNWGNEPDNNGDQDALCIGLEATPINSAGKWTDLDGNKNQLHFVIEYD